MVRLETVELARATEEDARVLAGISKRAFDSDVHFGGSGEGGPWGYDSAEGQVAFMGFCDYYRILYNGLTVGGLMVHDKGNGHYECVRIFVDANYHRRGIATRAFELAWALYPDAKIWTLDTPEWNVRTNSFYEKLGFVKIGKMGDLVFYEKVMPSVQPYLRAKIVELKDGMKGVELDAEVLKVSEPREIRSTGSGQICRVAEALIRDDTGAVELRLRDEKIGQVSAGDTVRIDGGYVTSFCGEIQLNAGKYCQLIILL